MSKPSPFAATTCPDGSLTTGPSATPTKPADQKVCSDFPVSVCAVTGSSAAGSIWNTTRREATGMASQPRSAGAARSVIVPSAPDWDGPGDGTVGGIAEGAAGLAHAA